MLIKLVVVSIFLLNLFWPARIYLAAEIIDNNEYADRFVEIPADADLLKEMRKGGFVLYLRHGKTDFSQPDRVPIDLDDCSTQRPLSQDGRDQMRAIGTAIHKAGVPVSLVYCSPLCRAKESAELAFTADIWGDEAPKIIIDKNLMYTAHLTSAAKVPIVKRTRELISAPLNTDTDIDADNNKAANRVIVAHAPNLADMMDYFPEMEGTLVVFIPENNGEYTYLASIRPDQWEMLIGTAPADLID